MLKNFTLISICWLATLAGFAQGNQHVLLSDSASVAIRMNGEIVAAWNIAPDTRPWTQPDVFTIDRSLHVTRVTYISNRDSLSFDVKPGDRYDFVIVIKNRGRFLMGLTTFPAPLFQCLTIRLTVFFIFLFAGGLVWFSRQVISTKFLLWCAIASPSLFWLLTITGGFIHGSYHHFHMVVSELGAIGTRSEFYMSAGETLLGLLSALSVIGLYRSCRQAGLNGVPVLTILSLSVSMVWAAFFPMHHDLHGAMGPIPLILIAGSLLAIIVWRAQGYSRLRLISFFSFVLMMLILLRTIPSFRGHWEGLIQRFFYLGWTIWSVGLSRFFLLRMKTDRHRQITRSGGQDN